MTLKDMMLGSAIAALVAGGAIAQTADTTTPESGSATEEPMTAPESSMDSNTGTAAESTPDAGSTMAPEAGIAADGENDTTMGAETDMAQEPASINEMTVDQVVGSSVVGIDDETVGDINYVVEQTDGLAFVIGVGGFLGLGEYSVAIPADQFSMNDEGDLALTSMTKEELETMPEFDDEGVEDLDGELVIGDLMSS
jgi:hypothetical protein